DALAAAFLAYIAFDAHHHARHDDAVAAIGLVVHRVRDKRRLAMHADAVHHRRIALVDEAIRDLPGFLGDLAESHAGLHDPDVVLNLVMRHAVERLLVGRRLARAAAEGAREVGIVAVAADRVGIERDQLTRPDLAAARLVEPW